MIQILISVEFGVPNFQKGSLVVSFFADEHTRTAAAVVSCWGISQILMAVCCPSESQIPYFSGLLCNMVAKEVSFVFLLSFSIRLLDFFSLVLFPQQAVWLICALYGICTQQCLPDGVFKKQCYNISTAGIVGFHADVLVKLGISVETSRFSVS